MLDTLAGLGSKIADLDKEIARRAREDEVSRRLMTVPGIVLQASKRGAPKGSWLEQMLARKPRMLVTVALANKMARIVWALLVKQENYRALVAAKA